MSLKYGKAYADLDEAVKEGGATAVKASKNIREIRSGLMSSDKEAIENLLEGDESSVEDRMADRLLEKYKLVKESNKRLLERIKTEIDGDGSTT
mgnify:FL=1|tara:strand:- start:5157 stop:5438 length:282 start_codon:yes stop_codon:yes gene_type:complete